MHDWIHHSNEWAYRGRAQVFLGPVQVWYNLVSRSNVTTTNSMCKTQAQKKEGIAWKGGSFIL